MKKFLLKSLRLFILIILPAIAQAQAPGGVTTDIYMWLKADQGVTQSLGGVSSWGNQLGSGVEMTQTISDRRPAYIPSSPQFNGNAALSFDIDNDGMESNNQIETAPYSFFVVYRSTTSSTANRRMVAGRENWLIGPYNNKSRFHPGSWAENGSKTIGVEPFMVSAILDTASANNAFFYHNGEDRTNPSGGYTSTGYPGNIALGGAGAYIGQAPGADIAELIAYDRDVSAAERNKIETYLAVKYGISIDQTIKQHYTSSNNTVVWDKLFNGAFPNSIFGVGVDNGSGLNQLQSKSVNHNILRITASAGITNNSYLLLSDNGATTGPFKQVGLPGGAIAASKRIWTASKTGTIGSIDLTVNSNLTDLILLIDNDNNGVYEIAMNPTSTSGKDFTFAGVTLNHFAKVKIGYKKLPPGPGGVATDMKLWLKGDDANTTDGSLVDLWSDASGQGKDFSQTDPSDQPELVANAINGNPALKFEYDIMGNINGLVGTATLDNINIYTVVENINPGGNTDYMREPVVSGDLRIYIPYSNTVYWRPRTPDATYAHTSLPNRTKPYLHSFHSSTTVGQLLPSQKSVSMANGQMRGQNATWNGLTGNGSQMQIGINGPEKNIAEFIAYFGPIDMAKHLKIQSYLAIKYGTPIAQDSPVPYVKSNGDTTWNPSSNGVFKENIFGIGKDSAGNLNQQQSVCSFTDRVRITNPSVLADQSFLILSDNDSSQTPVTTSGLPGSNTTATPLGWNVNKTGTVGTVDLTFTVALNSGDLLIDNNNDGIFEAAIVAASITSTPDGYVHSFPGLSLNNQAKLKLGYKCTAPTASPFITFTQVTTPSLTACSGPGSFVVRVKNLSPAAINNITFRDSLPPNIEFVEGTLAGTGVTFGSKLPNNVYTFNIASIGSSDSVDITFGLLANCAVSTTPTDIVNTYRAEWNCFYTNPFVTQNYPILFPSFSIQPDNTGLYNAVCGQPVVKGLTICNGGFGSTDSVIITHDENAAGFVVTNFSHGEITGAGTMNAKTVLRSADFIALGIGPTFDQNECITVYDTMTMIPGYTNATRYSYLKAFWGCQDTYCTNGTTNNEFTSATKGVGTGGSGSYITRTLNTLSGTDSAGQIYNRRKKYEIILKNTGGTVAINVASHPIVRGLEYIDLDSIWAKKNAFRRYHPTVWTSYNAGGYRMWGTPGQHNFSYENYTGKNELSNARISVGDIEPGDSVIITFEVGTAGPIDKYNTYSSSGGNWWDRFSCNGSNNYDYDNRDGATIGTVRDARTYWYGCPNGFYNFCGGDFVTPLYNGRDSVPINMPMELRISRFRNYNFVDSTNFTTFERCAYDNEDTVKILIDADVVDLPFMTDKTSFAIKIKTNGGTRWAGDLDKTFCRLRNWGGAEPWYADRVVDNSVADSTIWMYFKKSDLGTANAAAWANNPWNSYMGGGMDFVIHFINECPGPPVKRIWYSKVYNIDTTNNEPPMETGNYDFQANFEWNSICPAYPCLDGVSVLDFSQERSTFGAPDNNYDGIGDASGALNFDTIEVKRITWGDTLTVKMKMVVHTTQAGGVPYMHMKSDILYASAVTATSPQTVCNNFLKKDFPRITLKRPGVGAFNAVGTAEPVNTLNTYIADISLQGDGGFNIPGINAYQDGDTVELTQHLIYYERHDGWNEVKFAMLHVPYTSSVDNPPTEPQKFKCDSVICNFDVVDMATPAAESEYGAVACGNELTMWSQVYAQTDAATCGQTYFPGEARNVLLPTVYKLRIPAASRWNLKTTPNAVRTYFQERIKGSQQCAWQVNNQIVPATHYVISGDTLIIDLVALGTYFGQDVKANTNLRSLWRFDFDMVYTPTPSQTGCTKDHTDVAYTFPVYTKYETFRPFNDSLIKAVPHGINVNLAWPWVNNNTISLRGSANINVASPLVMVPITYNRGSSRVYGHDFMYIPPAAGLVIDSVKHSNGTLIPEYSTGMYSVPYGTANYDVYTRLLSCGNPSLVFSADRTPCSGAPPTSWAAYACKDQVNTSGAVNFTSFDGELQMKDSLYTSLKEICTDDTVQFNVLNSQLTDINTVKVSFELPQNMDFIPGQTQYKMALGPWTTIADPVLTAGVYTWTMPATDTLRRLNPLVPDSNELFVRVGISTSCGFVSGGQITSSIAGQVGCGPVTSLFNTNPAPLDIIGAPTLNYFTNPTITISQVDDCSPTASFDYNVHLVSSGAATGASDSIVINLPVEYQFDSYVAAAGNSKNAPVGQPNIHMFGTGRQQLTWQTPPGIQADTIRFKFKYKERLGNGNICSITEPRRTWLNTIITTPVYCAKIMATCPVAISNGVDTAYMYSEKPNLTATATAHYEQGCDNAGSYSYLNITGTILNNGSADLTAPTNLIMEAFIDKNFSGTVDSGDIAFAPYVYANGLAKDSSLPFTYRDSMLVAGCDSCSFKDVIIRFSNTPTSPASSSQCLCDSLTEITITPTIDVKVKPDAGTDKTVDCAVLPGGVAALTAIGGGFWTIQTGNAGTSTLATPTSSICNVTNFSAVGDYYYIWEDTSSDGLGCKDTVKVTVTEKPNAGTDKVVSCIATFPGGTTAMTATTAVNNKWVAMTGNPGTARIVNEFNATTAIDSFTAVGTYSFLWTDTNTGCADTADIVVSDKANAGPDTIVPCVILPGGSANMHATGAGVWSAQSGNPGTATITANTNPMTTITNFSATGTYNYIWTAAGCADTASIIVTEKPDAGADQSISCVVLPGGSATLTGSVAGVWQAVSTNPAPVTIATPNAASTTVSNFTLGGTYQFLRRDSLCTDTVVVTITVKPNAGPDQQGCALTIPGGSVTMQGVGLGNWSAMVGNPGTANINFPSAQNTSIDSFSAVGDYYFILDNGVCQDTAKVVVSPKPVAGPDQNVSCLLAFPGGSATMAAVAPGTWSPATGNPGTATIGASSSPTTAITNFSDTGTYKFLWTSPIGCIDTAFVVVSGKPNAGTDKTVTCAPKVGGSSVTMSGFGLGTWSARLGNPTPAPSITTATDSATTITGIYTAGTYGYIWTNAAGCKDTALITVTSQPNAGVDKSTLCVIFPGGSTTMSATAVTGGTWSAMTSNPSVAIITTPTAANTTITNYNAAGTYNFIWTNGSGCIDTAVVIVTGKASAGPDQTITCIPSLPGGSVTMAATAVTSASGGQWTAGANNPGNAVITFQYIENTTITGFDAPGVYAFIWDDGLCTDTMTVTVTAKPNAGPDDTVSCLTSFPGGTAMLNADGSGNWRAIPGNPGTASITDTALGTTTITAFSASGQYKFGWMNAAGCEDTAMVEVTEKPTAGGDQTVSCAILPGGSATMAATGVGIWSAMLGNPDTASIVNPNSPTTAISTYGAKGVFNFIWTNNDGCKDTAQVSVTEKPNAGSDDTLSCVILPGGSVTMKGTGAGTWTAIAGNPGTATVTTATDSATTITNYSAAGTYSFMWTNADGCMDTAQVIVTEAADAGGNDTVNCVTLPGGSATMTANGLGTWTPITGNPGTATITGSTSPTTTITNFTAAGTYKFAWSSAAGCADTAEVIVTELPDAGADQTVSCVTLPGGSATMAAVGAGIWSALTATNPGTATIVTATSATTDITTYSAAGTYKFVFTNADGCTDTAQVIVTEAADAGGDQTVSCVSLPGGSATMTANGLGTWTADAANPGTATITGGTSPTTTITNFSAAGVYKFSWASAAGCTDSAQITVTELPNAGTNKIVNCVKLPGGSTTMSGTGTGTWTSLAANPGTATIVTASSATTDITTYSAAGTYQFVFTNAAGCTDTAEITVTEAVDAGADQTVSCVTLPGGSATMTGSGAGTWTAQTGNPGTATITASTSPTTTITNYSIEGTYNFIYTNAVGCTDTAQVVITEATDAGGDQIVSCVTLPGGNATMAAVGMGTWTALTSNPGTATITDTALATTTITNYSAAGTYQFVYTNAGGCTDTAAITVSGQANAGADQTLTCVTLPGGTANMAASGTGVWSMVSGNPGTSVITDTALATTTITTFSHIGDYNYVWTSGGCTDTVTISVGACTTPDTITVRAQCDTCSTAPLCPTADDLPGGTGAISYSTCGLSPTGMGTQSFDTATGCIVFTGNALQGPNDTIRSCTVACKDGICDTTFINILPPPIPDTVVTLIPTCGTCPTQSVCPTADDLPSVGSATYTNCGLDSVEATQGTLTIDSLGCVVWTPNGSQTDTITTCVVKCMDNICDTTYIFIAPTSSAVPVILSNFEVTESNCSVKLNWTTAQEQNTAYFNVMRKGSTDNSFVEIGKVNAAGNSTGPKMYNYLDADLPTGIYEYKLQTVDMDHSEWFSETKVVRLSCNNSNILVYPNPASNVLNITINSTEIADFDIRFSDIAGRTILETETLVDEEKKTVYLSIESVANGVYNVMVTNRETNITETFKVRVQR